MGSVRLITLHLCIALLSHLLYLDYSYTVVTTIPDSDPSSAPPASLLSEHHSKKLERAMEESCRRMEKFYRSLVSVANWLLLAFIILLLLLLVIVDLYCIVLLLLLLLLVIVDLYCIVIVVVVVVVVVVVIVVVVLYRVKVRKSS